MLVAHFACAADVPKESPFAQAGGSSATTAGADPLEFAGVSIVGKRTSINLYDKATKRSFWVDVGATSGGVTVVKYDSTHDQVTVKRDGVEKTLPLRAASSVVNGASTLAPALAAAPVPAPAPAAPAPATPTSTSSLSQARQEEEARMLVSDLLEIGMAQRRAYEEAQRRAAATQNGQATVQPPAVQPTGASTPTDQNAVPAAAQPAQPAATGTPSGG